MTCETNCIEEDNLPLIDFKEEDDYLIEFPFRDSLEDLRLSVTFDNVNERIYYVQSELIEQRRSSFLRESLAWDSAFFTSAGVLNSDELFMINEGFKKTGSNQPSPGTNKHIQRHRVVSKELTSSDKDSFQLETLEDDLFIDVKPKIYKLGKISNAATSGPACSPSNSLSSKKMNICSQKVKPVGAPKRRDLDLQGPKNMTKTRLQDNLSKLPKLMSSRHDNNAAVEGSPTENKTRKAGTAPALTVSKRSRRGDLSGLPKSTSLTSPSAEKKSEAHHSYESSSSASSFKSIIRRKINPKNTKLIPNSPSSVHFPLSSTCSSSTSPASSIDGWISESLSSKSIITHTNPGSSTPALAFESQNYEEMKFTSQKASRSSIGTTLLSSVGPKRKIKSSGLRMPSPKIGFFDEEPMFSGSMQDRERGQSSLPTEKTLKKLHSFTLSPSVSPENCLKVGKNLSREHDSKKFGAGCSKVKPKRQKDDTASFQKQDKSDQKENVCSLNDQVTDLIRHLDDIDLNKDLEEVKGQRIRELLRQGQVTPPRTADHTTPCSRTPLAEKVVW